MKQYIRTIFVYKNQMNEIIKQFNKEDLRKRKLFYICSPQQNKKIKK